MKEDNFKINKNDSREVSLENHEIGDYRIYRLHYINYYKLSNNYDGLDKEGVIENAFIPFMFPERMDRNEGLKVLSYLIDFIEMRDDVDKSSLRSIRILDDVLNLKRFGFRRLQFIPKDEYIIDLFTVRGDVSKFKENELYLKYFDWYVPGVTKDEVVSIYKRCRKEFEDIIFLDKNVSKRKMLKK